MITTLTLPDFLAASAQQLILDVRTPAEFQQGHLPGAVNLPLFTNEERVLVGTCYKQQGRQAAILLGFELVGGRWATFIREVEAMGKGKKVFVHCWRGGMRSGAMAWALSLYGFDVFLLKGGYKQFRRYCLDTFEQRFPLLVLGGKTGSAKSLLLRALQPLGEQIVDLEAIAKHQGSSFGSKGVDEQPTQEQFENNLAMALRQLDCSRRIWVENESVVIGYRVIPSGFFEQMRRTQVIEVMVPYDARVDFLEEDYGRLDKDFLCAAVQKISKRLGPNETKLTLQAIHENRMKDFIRMVLVYYDKFYQRSRDNRLPETIHELELTSIDPPREAPWLQAFANALFGENITALLPELPNTTLSS